MRCTLVRMPALGSARQAVVGNRLPRRRVRDELAHARTYPRVCVQGAQPNADTLRIRRIRAVQGRSAERAEPLLKAAGWSPRAECLGARDDPKRSGLHARVGRGRGSGPALAARAVTVVGGHERREDLKAHGAAAATAGEGMLGAGGHRGHDSGAPITGPCGACERRQSSLDAPVSGRAAPRVFLLAPEPDRAARGASFAAAGSLRVPAGARASSRIPSSAP
jgi:hypothetical protein